MDEKSREIMIRKLNEIKNIIDELRINCEFKSNIYARIINYNKDGTEKESEYAFTTGKIITYLFTDTCSLINNNSICNSCLKSRNLLLLIYQK